MRKQHGLLPLLTLLLLWLPTPPTVAQTDSGDNWDDVEVSEGEFAPPPGGFGLFAGPTFEYSLLKTLDLDPELDHPLILKGGYGYVILSGWLLGGGGAGIELNEPNDQYDRFSLGFGGFLTGYDKKIAGNLTGRLAMLVGGGGIEMVKKRPDLSALGEHEFLERYRSEEFFLVRGELSLGYMILPFIDLRLAGSYLYPIGGGDVDDLRNFTAGIHVMFGFRNGLMN